MADTTNPSLFETLLPLLAAGTAAAFPRYGAPAVGLGLTTYDLLQRQQERTRYSEMIQKKRNDDAAAGRTLQRSIHQALPAEAEIPSDASPETAASMIGDLQYQHGPADLAAAAVGAGQADRGLELAKAELERRAKPEGIPYSQASGMPAPPAGAKYSVKTREGIDYTRETPNAPAQTQRASSDFENFQHAPNEWRAYEQAKARVAAQNRSDPKNSWELQAIQEQETDADGNPVFQADGTPKYTGKTTFLTHNKETNAFGPSTSVQGSRAAPGGPRAPKKDKAGKGGVLANLLGGGQGKAGASTGVKVPAGVQDGQTATSSKGTKLVAQGGEWHKIAAQD